MNICNKAGCSLFILLSINITFNMACGRLNATARNETPDSLMHDAQNAYENGNYAKASELYTKVVNKDQSNSTARIGLAYSLNAEAGLSLTTIISKFVGKSEKEDNTKKPTALAETTTTGQSTALGSLKSFTDIVGVENAGSALKTTAGISKISELLSQENVRSDVIIKFNKLRDSWFAVCPLLSDTKVIQPLRTNLKIIANEDATLATTKNILRNYFEFNEGGRCVKGLENSTYYSAFFAVVLNSMSQALMLTQMFLDPDGDGNINIITSINGDAQNNINKLSATNKAIAALKADKKELTLSSNENVDICISYSKTTKKCTETKKIQAQYSTDHTNIDKKTQLEKTFAQTSAMMIYFDNATDAMEALVKMKQDVSTFANSELLDLLLLQKEILVSSLGSLELPDTASKNINSSKNSLNQLNSGINQIRSFVGSPLQNLQTASTTTTSGNAADGGGSGVTTQDPLGSNVNEAMLSKIVVAAPKADSMISEQKIKILEAKNQASSKDDQDKAEEQEKFYFANKSRICNSFTDKDKGLLSIITKGSTMATPKEPCECKCTGTSLTSECTSTEENAKNTCISDNKADCDKDPTKQWNATTNACDAKATSLGINNVFNLDSTLNYNDNINITYDDWFNLFNEAEYYRQKEIIIKK